MSLSNDLTLYRREVRFGFRRVQFTNIPPNVYHLEVHAPGFEHYHRDLTVRSAVPVNLEIRLAIETQRQSVAVTTEAALMEDSPSAHSDADRALFAKLPTASIATGLSDIITLATPAVVADSDGFFHSLGDHAQMALSIDNQPITDQQGSLFSTQIPANAIESIEAVYGGTPAEYGDKTSLVVTAVTRSGLGQKTHGSFSGRVRLFRNLRRDEPTSVLAGRNGASSLPSTGPARAVSWIPPKYLPSMTSATT